MLRSVDTALVVHTWVYRYLLCRRTGKVWSSFGTSVGGQGVIPSPPMGQIHPPWRIVPRQIRFAPANEPFDLIPSPSRVYDLAPSPGQEKENFIVGDTPTSPVIRLRRTPIGSRYP